LPDVVPVKTKPETPKLTQNRVSDACHCTIYGYEKTLRAAPETPRGERSSSAGGLSLLGLGGTLPWREKNVGESLRKNLKRKTLLSPRIFELKFPPNGFFTGPNLAKIWLKVWGFCSTLSKSLEGQSP
jgi:hypothetical protein